MDPNHWNLGQAYGRLPPNATGLGGNPRFDLLDQASLSSQGLGGLAVPAAHSSGLASLTPVNYGLHTAMPGYLDSAVLAGQPYKGMSVSQPYGLDSRGPPDLIRFPSSTVSPPSVTSKALYTDPRADPLTVPGSYGTMTAESKYAGVSSGGLVGSVGNDIYSSPLTSAGLGGLQPPPAHSGSSHSMRASTIQRNPYQPDKYEAVSGAPRPEYGTKSPFREMVKHEMLQKDSLQPSHVGYPDPSRPQAGAAPVYQSPPRSTAYSEPGRPTYDSPHPASGSYDEPRGNLYDQRPPATSSYAQVSSGQQGYHDVIPRTQAYQEGAMSGYLDSRRPSNSMYPDSSPPVPTNRGSYPNSPQVAAPQLPASTAASHYTSYNSPTAQSFATKKPTYVSSRQYGAGYDAMSPEAQQPHTPDSRYSTIAYSDLDMKQPNSGLHGNAAMGPGYQEMSPVGSQQPSPLAGASHPSPGMHHSPHQASPLTPHQPSPMQPSPMQPSSMGAGSPQVPMGSPQAVSNAIHQPSPATVQAVADSTTKPRKRQRRKKSDKPVLPPPAKIPAMQGQYDMPGKNYIPAGYGTQYPAGYEAQSPGMQPGMTPVGSPGMQPPPGGLTDYSSMSGQQQHPTSPGQPLMPNQNSPYPPTSEYNSNVQPMQEHMQAYQQPLSGPPIRPQYPPNDVPYVKSEFPGPVKTSPSPPPQQLQPAAPVQLKQEANLKQEVKSETKAAVTMDPDDEFAHLAASPKVAGANTDEKSGDKKSKTFLNSYLSFIQGEKGETLTSVKNSDMSQKPELPKYIPEPRPPVMRRPPDDPMFEADTDSNSSAPKNDSKPEDAASKPGGEDENPLGQMSMSQELAMMVNLDSVNIQPEPEEIPEELPTFDLEMERRQLAEQLKRLNKGKKKKKKGTGVPESRAPTQLALQDGEKRYTLSDSSISDASVEVEEPEVASSPDSIVDQKGYDSDKDPVWRPGAKKMPKKLTSWNSSGSEDESWAPSPRSKSRGRGRGRGGGGARGGRGRGRGGRAKAPQPPMVPLVKFPKGPNVPRGEFVVEKNDINQSRFPIWKIDGGRLLQKFEPFECDGRIRHKPMTTYSSWAESVRHKFHHIKVTLICQARGKEIVEVVKSSLANAEVTNSPAKTDSPNSAHKPSPSNHGSQVSTPQQPEASAEDSSEDEDPLLHPFNVYMQILISQALEPGFLGAILEEGDDYYKDPQHKIDTLLATKKDLLAECLQWSPKLKTAVECSPFLNVSDRHMYANDNLQSMDPTQVKSVRVHGNPYIRETLDLLDDENFPSQEFPVEPLLAQQVELYHRLHHFKFIVYQKCLAKVASMRCANSTVENRDILDRCLQDRGWVQKLLQELYDITRRADELTITPS